MGEPYNTNKIFLEKSPLICQCLWWNKILPHVYQHKTSAREKSRLVNLHKNYFPTLYEWPTLLGKKSVPNVGSRAGNLICIWWFGSQQCITKWFFGKKTAVLLPHVYWQKQHSLVNCLSEKPDALYRAPVIRCHHNQRAQGFENHPQAENLIPSFGSSKLELHFLDFNAVSFYIMISAFSSQIAATAVSKERTEQCETTCHFYCPSHHFWASNSLPYSHCTGEMQISHHHFYSPICTLCSELIKT